MTNDRVLNLVEDLERTLVEFIRKHGITHDEYRAATDLIIAEVQAGEASLLFDVFLEAAATDEGNHGRAGSIEAIEGPFYLPGAPMLEGAHPVMPQRADEPGVPLVFHGQVTAEDGTPLAGAELDLWQADANGEYSQIHPGVPDWHRQGPRRTRPALLPPGAPAREAAAPALRRAHLAAVLRGRAVPGQ
jgi:catechol 1,2-dioxygenase